MGMASRSGLICVVVNVVWRGRRPSGCLGGAGGDVRMFLRVGAFVVIYLSIVYFPLGVVITVALDTQVGFQVILNGMERIVLSSSSGLSRVRCEVVRPPILWCRTVWQ